MKKVLLLHFILFSGILQARDYTFGPEQVIQIKQLLGSGELRPGDRVVLEDGTYTGWEQFDFYAYGTSDAPVTFKAQNPGKVIFSGAMGLCLYGEHLFLDGFVFRDAWAVKGNLIDFRKEAGVCAYYSRITNCVIDNCNDQTKDRKTSTENWIVLHGTHNRIDHCYFARKWVAGIIVQVWLDANGESYNNYHRIDHNFFGERAPLNANGAEIFRIGHSWSSQFPSCSIIEDNVFYHCDGENETISVKSCRNIVRRNLFYENRGSITLRHGHNNLVESNVFIGNNLKNTMGIRVINQGHKIYNNYLQDITGTGSDAAMVVRMGVYEKPTPETDLKKEPLVSYHRVVDVDIAYNTFINCTLIEFGQGNGDKEPRNVRFANNLISAPNVESNITVSNPAVFPGIKCSGNYVSFREGADFKMEGFTLAPFSFEKPATGPSKGIYLLRNKVRTELASGFDYITTDATGAPRTDNSTPGAVQFSNQDKRFNIVPFDDCGPGWYEPLKKDVESITQKTTF
ncbi:MAG: polysaccharide lyase 6 family protein [Tannerella sp.]|jgi:poly(beta-D-mannuronate) lyase|nr:polysaccharide lyase 6 family protein [Tannerella sp.]